MNTPAVFDENRPVPIIDSAKCNGCGICVPACPNRALELREKKAVVSDPQACEYTGACELICPTQAIVRPYLILFSAG